MHTQRTFRRDSSSVSIAALTSSVSGTVERSKSRSSTAWNKGFFFQIK